MGPRRRRGSVALLLAVAALAGMLGGCGSEDFQDARDRVEERFEARVEAARRDFEERRERYGRRIRQVLGDLERVFPRAERTSPTVRSRGSTCSITATARAAIVANVPRHALHRRHDRLPVRRDGLR